MEEKSDFEKDMIVIKYNLRIMQIKRTIQTMMQNHLLKEWIPEYTYQGCDRADVIIDHVSAFKFMMKKYGKIRANCIKKTESLNTANELITSALNVAKANFNRRKKVLLEFGIITKIPESRIKQAISSNLIDFFKYDKNGVIHSIKLCNIIT